MKKQLSTLALTLAAATAFGLQATAQELSAEVVRNPDDTVTYTIDLDGPPNGLAFALFATPSALLPGYTLPGFFGSFYLDLNAAIAPLPVLATNAQGKLTLDFTLTAGLFNGLPLYSQYLVVDGDFNFAMTNLSMLYSLDAPAQPGLQSLQLANSSAGSLAGQVAGEAGTQVVIEQRSAQGALKGATQVTLPIQGQANYSLQTGPIQFGDQTHVLQDVGGGLSLFQIVPWHN